MRQYFYNETIRMCIVAFSQMFNEIQINVGTKDSPELKTVPLKFGPSSIYDNKRKTANDLYVNTGVMLSYDLVNIAIGDTPDPTTVHVCQGTDGKFYSTPSPVPVTLSFTLTIKTTKYNTALEILEQIVPYFTPAQSVILKHSNPFINGVVMNISLDSNIDRDIDFIKDSSEGDRNILHILNFKTTSKLYKIIEVDEDGSSVIQTIDLETAMISLEQAEELNFDYSGLEDPDIDRRTLS